MTQLMAAAGLQGWDSDPLDPPLDAPTPPAVVASLTRPQREQRLDALVAQAWTIVDLALAEHLRSRKLAHRCVMFSGGNDSTVGAHLFRHYATAMLHADTGTGVAETQQFVRETAATWGLPLVLRRAPDSYDDLILGRIPTAHPGGFPGPGAHGITFTRLKERAWDLMRREDLALARSRSRAALFLSFRRRAESDRRMQDGQVPLNQPDGTVIWASPLANWTKLDLNTYRLRHRDVPQNPVSANLHMSGECLCGAFARREQELPLLEAWYPAAAEAIHRREHAVAAAGFTGPTAQWGHYLTGKQLRRARMEWLCGKCDSNQLTIPRTE